MRSITPRMVAVSTLACVAATLVAAGGAGASTPASSTLAAPTSGDTATAQWSGGPYTGAVLDPSTCTATTCDTHAVELTIPADYWSSHRGGVEVAIAWASSADDYDLYVDDSAGRQIGSSAAGNTTSEKVDLGTLAPGTYTVRVVPYTTAGSTYSGTATLTGTAVPTGMLYPETRKAVEDELVVDYPLNVVFVGRTPTAAEVAELREWTPDTYKPTVATKTTASGELTQVGAGLLNWNKDHVNGTPYFEGMTYRYDISVLAASEEYAKALFQVAENATAKAQTYHGGTTRTANQVKYDQAYGALRVAAKDGDLSYKVADPTKTDLVDAYAVEDWIFETRYDDRWACAFTNLETGECSSPAVVNPDAGAYHDPYYDKSGLNLDRMPQGPNQGSSFFFLDTFTPGYAKDYFRPGAYHTYGTDKVIDGAIVPKAVEDGGSWRITDPDTGDWDGIDFGRTWGGRYRFHFIDLGAAPNDFESATWAGKGLGMSSDYPHGDPPVWHYTADPLWKQSGDTCATDGTKIAGMDLPYNNTTPCRMMPRLARDVAYGLFFRSTAGYLYRPIPRGDTYWLAVSNWTDFYSRPQWVNGALTNAPWYGSWWTDMDKLYKIGDVSGGTQQDDTLRWLSSATPYARWVGRKGETIPLYDPTNNLPTGEVLDTSPKYEDLPAPSHHVVTNDGTELVPEPLHEDGHDHDHEVTYGDKTVDLEAVQEALEKAKATGSGLGPGYDGAVSHESFRDFIDANPDGIADQVDGVNTIPAINVVFEKAYTWALPAIVGGIAVGTEDGEAWGVMNNVNDRFKSSDSHYPGVQPGDAPGSKRSLTDASLPTQDSGGGFSYTIEHEAAHNLGLSHPHDGSYGVDRCPAGHPQAGKWECYWSGLGWMYDVSAAPTTYAMSYRPYEVEDQDNLQRGHVAEYLIGAQEALGDRLAKEAAGGRTSPSSAWSADFARMKDWRAQAGTLFRAGDYLHAEYAARNAALAARGVPQTAANTSAPKLVEAGQVFYFTVNPQGDGRPAAKAQLRPTAVESAQPERKQTTLSVTVENAGSADADGVAVKVLDGSTVLGTTAPVKVAAGASRVVTLAWDTRGVNGDRKIRVDVDPQDAVSESDETDNSLTRTITVRGNRVTNGSYEASAGGAAPDGWTGSGGTAYDTSGDRASDGTDAVGVTGGLTGGAWRSDVPVEGGTTYDLALTAVDGTPAVAVTFLDKTGSVVSKIDSVDVVVSKIDASVSKIGSSVSKIDGTVSKISGTLAVPAGASTMRLTLAAPATQAPGTTIWLDDVWVW
ncbi:CARDB domain-containing protein [uncultured Phycicoccus sp.]|uniref:CARDB domain-containing protein n=1 Tax=uncultured Phycicoccus sp. TaxID=661422 RepID=UPI00262357DC|nr:CARDB domain-containing protein [uncultured Phycicoccus sp.]